mmetsp:Transcript_29066/g.51742  ORF Transcript_29066/g.51742 Transcript_29066/m.51742 type:complete len:90 (+) Transcript_29066:1178-1447(+)
MCREQRHVVARTSARDRKVCLLTLTASAETPRNLGLASAKDREEYLLTQRAVVQTMSHWIDLGQVRDDQALLKLCAAEADASPKRARQL